MLNALVALAILTSEVRQVQTEIPTLTKFNQRVSLINNKMVNEINDACAEENILPNIVCINNDLRDFSYDSPTVCITKPGKSKKMHNFKRNLRDADCLNAYLDNNVVFYMPHETTRKPIPIYKQSTESQLNLINDFFEQEKILGRNWIFDSSN